MRENLNQYCPKLRRASAIVTASVTETSPFLKIAILIGMSACKFHKHRLSQFAVTDCLNDDIGCNEISFMAVTYEQADIAELIDQTWSFISSIQNGIIDVVGFIYDDDWSLPIFRWKDGLFLLG